MIKLSGKHFKKTPTFWYVMIFTANLENLMISTCLSEGIPEFLDSRCKCWTLDAGLWTLDAGLWTLDSGCYTLPAGYWTVGGGQWTLDSGCWTLHAALCLLEYGCWMLDAGCWNLDATLSMLGSGRWTLSLLVSEQNQNPVSDSVWLNYWKFTGCKSLRTSWSCLFCGDYRLWFGYF